MTFEKCLAFRIVAVQRMDWLPDQLMGSKMGRIVITGRESDNDKNGTEFSLVFLIQMMERLRGSFHRCMVEQN